MTRREERVDAVSFETIFAGLTAAFFLIGVGWILRRRKKSEFGDALLLRLVELSDDASFLTTVGGPCLAVNQRACDLLGYTRSELLALSWEEIEAAGDGFSLGRFLMNAAAGEIVSEGGLLRHRDGSELAVAIRGTLHTVGKRHLLLIWARDTGERLRLDSELLESRARYQSLSEEFKTLLDGIPDSLSLLDPDGALIWANRSTAEYLEAQGDSLQGKSSLGLWFSWADSPGPLLCPIRESFRSGKAAEGLDRTPDGKIWGVKAFPLTDGAGKVTRVIRLASDITEKFAFREEALRNSRLAALGELAAGVAHEINNPNGLIILNLSLLADVWADAQPVLEAHWEEERSFTLGGMGYERMRTELPMALAEMEDSAGRIRRIVVDLKDFARQDPLGGNKPFDFNESVRTAVRLVAATIRRATAVFDCRYEEGLPQLFGSAQRIEQVVINLLLNACQALSDGDGGLFLTTGFDAERGINILEIRDQGRGIAPEHLPHILEPFFTTRRDTGGTGLGLSVSVRIVKEHGGSLHYDSTVGEGTTATLSLPVKTKDDTDE
jgi:PAS domain S-box-containing protein